MKQEKPRYAIVELKQLEKLLQRCPECGELPSGKNTGKQREVTWIESGTNLTAYIRCACVGKKNNTNYDKVYWSCQDFIPGTQTRTGNLALVSAARVAPIEYVDLAALFDALLLLLAHLDDVYYRQQADIYSTLNGPIQISLDGQFDSPGFSAELCMVAAIEETTKKVLDFSITHKSEVENVSGRMEKMGVIKCLESIEKRNKVDEITVDKHASIVAYLKSKNYDYHFDPWHRLRSLIKDLRSAIKEMDDDDEKECMKDLAKRFIVHVNASIERSNGIPSFLKELVYSFFLHIQGIHSWTARKFTDLIPVEPDTKTCPRFKTESFKEVIECPHVTDRTIADSRHDPIDPRSRPFQTILKLTSKAVFMSDLDRLRPGKLTSYNESFNSIRIHYCPKRKYFPREGFEKRTMIAVMDWNHIQDAEMSGERRISEVAMCFSKPKQAKVPKVKKLAGSRDWKKVFVDETLSRKEKYGPGDPITEADVSEKNLEKEKSAL